MWFGFRRRLVYAGSPLVNQQIGFGETDGGIWRIHFYCTLPATFEERDYRIRR